MNHEFHWSTLRLRPLSTAIFDCQTIPAFEAAKFWGFETHGTGTALGDPIEAQFNEGVMNP